MNIIKKLLNQSNESQKDFSEGDIFYTFFENQYHLYKLLKEDVDLNIYHVLVYKPINQLPSKDKLNELEILIYHSPIDKTGFNGALLYSNSTLTDNDLMGYYEYLRQTQNINELVSLANKYYKEANRLTDLKQYEKALDNYSKAIEFIPNFYEAIDNRAFCKMDLGKWTEAIEDFKLSLSVNPKSFLAEFSIGECYLNIGNYKEAIKQFQKSIEIEPANQIARNFLNRAMELDNK